MSAVETLLESTTHQASLLSASLTQIVSIILATQSLITDPWPKTAVVSNGDTFDFIVVGAGSAGAVVANRLSEIEKWKVLLIEAGGDPPITSVVPSQYTSLFSTVNDWNYTSINDNVTSQGCNGGSLVYSRGKMMGGSSSMNLMLYVRGHPDDYNEWADLGNESWDYETVLPYFIKSEGMQVDEILNNATLMAYHGKDGPLKISSATRHPIEEGKIEIVTNSLDEIGIPKINDYNSVETEGASKMYFTISEAPSQRQSTAESFLRPIKDRSNLYILKNSEATKVIIDDSKKATGVEVIVNNEVMQFNANIEVIVSAGAINTPKILLASGIGHTDELAKLEIDVIADLPVGDGMQDHIWVPVFITGADVKSGVLTDGPTVMADYLPFPSSTAFFRVYENSTRPDIQLIPSYFGINSLLALNTCYGFNYNSDICQSIGNINLDREFWMTVVVLARPKSRGSVKYDSVEAGATPIIRTGFFTDERDIVTMREGIKRVVNLKNSTYFKEHESFIGELDISACADYEFMSDNYWDCYVVYMANALYHPCATAAMGEVVDETLRVYGIDNLRVVDASIIPRIPGGNINAATIMIGEKASDMIKEDYNAE